jgi:hypothetical protein
MLACESFGAPTRTHAERVRMWAVVLAVTVALAARARAAYR